MEEKGEKFFLRLELDDSEFLGCLRAEMMYQSPIGRGITGVRFGFSLMKSIDCARVVPLALPVELETVLVEASEVVEPSVIAL